jgi:hypothetical protein
MEKSLDGELLDIASRVRHSFAFFADEWASANGDDVLAVLASPNVATGLLLISSGHS